MWHVYRAINLSKKEVYHGVSETPVERINRSHCAGGTKSIKHWVGLSGGAVLRMTVKCILKPLFFVENSMIKPPPNSNRQTVTSNVKTTDRKYEM